MLKKDIYSVGIFFIATTALIFCLTSCSCTGPTPGFCENPKDCPTSMTCDMTRRLCVYADATIDSDAAKSDATSDLRITQDGSSDVEVDALKCSGGWAKSYPAEIKALATDGADNIYITGEISVGATIGGKEIKGANIYIAKLDATGEFAWVTHPLGAVMQLHDIAADADGNSYIVGSFGTTITFGLTTFGFKGDCGDEGFLAKLDPTGKFAWAISVGGEKSHCDIIKSVVVDKGGNVIVAGKFSGETQVGSKTLYSYNSDDLFIAKYNSKGEFVWVAEIGGDDYEDMNTLALDEQGNIYPLVSSTSKETSFGYGKSVKNIGASDVLISKLDVNGTFIWAVPGGGTNHDEGKDLVADNEGYLYLAGYQEDGSFGTFSLHGKDHFIAKMKTNDGSFVWAKEVGGFSVSGLALAEKGSMFFFGGYHDKITIGSSTLISKGAEELYVAKMKTEDGKFLGALSSAGGAGGADMCVPNKLLGPIVTGEYAASTVLNSTTLTGGVAFIWDMKCLF